MILLQYVSSATFCKNRLSLFWIFLIVSPTACSRIDMASSQISPSSVSRKSSLVFIHSNLFLISFKLFKTNAISSFVSALSIYYIFLDIAYHYLVAVFVFVYEVNLFVKQSLQVVPKSSDIIKSFVVELYIYIYVAIFGLFVHCITTKETNTRYTEAISHMGLLFFESCYYIIFCHSLYLFDLV